MNMLWITGIMQKEQLSNYLLFSIQSVGTLTLKTNVTSVLYMEHCNGP